MKTIHAGTISTVTALFRGIALVVPTYFKFDLNRPIIMLVFNIVSEDRSSDWLASILAVFTKYNVPATVFVTGRFASSHPEWIDALAENIDAGSLTYSYVSITSITDYLLQLEEVKKGKKGVAIAGNLGSRLFRAPFGDTDDNIYSLLNHSGIYADCSYADHYNKFYNRQFIKFEKDSFDGSKYSAENFLSIETRGPFMIFYNDIAHVEKIDNFIFTLKSARCSFVNASGITGLSLTARQKT
ncbi:MAG: polysaccharide deacetylase family protein [Candidatus Bathyarchaeota archaeon]